MTRVFKTHFERFVFATTAFLFLVSFGGAWWARGELKNIRTNPIAVRFGKVAYQPGEWPQSEAEHESWTRPRPQSAGSGWVYELFTPPVVYFNPATEKFSATDPTESVKSGPTFAIELMAVRRELFRVQLSGYFGETDSPTAVFVQLGRPGTWFAREGTRIDELGLTLRRFSVRRTFPTDKPHAGSSERTAIAELLDERTNASVTLSSREPGFTDAPVATIRMNSPNATLRDVRAGDIIPEGKFVYRISRITHAPAELVVNREETDGAISETKVLHPITVDLTTIARRSAEPTALFPRPATGFVIPEK